MWFGKGRDSRSRDRPTFFAAAVIVRTWPVTSASIAALTFGGGFRIFGCGTVGIAGGASCRVPSVAAAYRSPRDPPPRFMFCKI
jgi:hypothetical protein